jgi:hypothetical protein
MHNATLAFIFVIYNSDLVQNHMHINQLRKMPKNSTARLGMIEMVPAAILTCIIGASGKE